MEVEPNRMLTKEKFDAMITLAFKKGWESAADAIERLNNDGDFNNLTKEETINSIIINLRKLVKQS